MGSVQTKYFIEYLAGGLWKKSIIASSDIEDAIHRAERMTSGRFDNVSSARIIEVKTITTERIMTLEFAKNERKN